MLNELTSGVYWMAADHATDRPVVAALSGDDATLMVEAGASPAHARQFLEALAEHDVPPVRWVVVTHAHWDHVFGAGIVDAPLIATEKTARELQVMATYEWTDAALNHRVRDGREIVFCRDMMQAEMSAEQRADFVVRTADQVFDTRRSLDLGGRSIDLLEVGGDHAADSCIVVVPGVVAFLGDCLYYNLHHEPNFYTRRRVFPLLDELLSLDVEWYVAGHDDAPMARIEFEQQAREIRAAGEAVARHATDARAIQESLEALPNATEYVPLFQAGRAHE